MYDKDSSANTVVLYDEINYYYVDYKKEFSIEIITCE